MSYRQLFAISVMLPFACWISGKGSGQFFARPAAAPEPARRGWAWLKRCSILRSQNRIQEISSLNASRCSPSLSISLPGRASLPATCSRSVRAGQRGTLGPKPQHTRRRGQRWECPGRQRKREVKANKDSAARERFLRRFPLEREVEERGERRGRRARPRIGRILPQNCGEGRGRGAARNPGLGSHVSLFLRTETQSCHVALSSVQGNRERQERAKGRVGWQRAGTW